MDNIITKQNDLKDGALILASATAIAVFIYYFRQNIFLRKKIELADKEDELTELRIRALKKQGLTTDQI